MGAGTALGQAAEGEGLRLGRHCVIDVPGAYAEDGTFIDPLFPQPVRISGGTTYG